MIECPYCQGNLVKVENTLTNTDWYIGKKCGNKMPKHLMEKYVAELLIRKLNE